MRLSDAVGAQILHGVLKLRQSRHRASLNATLLTIGKIRLPPRHIESMDNVPIQNWPKLDQVTCATFEVNKGLDPPLSHATGVPNRYPIAIAQSTVLRAEKEDG